MTCRPRRVVVVAYGSAPLLSQTLAALGAGEQVTVIDNSSSPAIRSAAEVANVKYLDPGENLGFAGAVNMVGSSGAASLARRSAPLILARRRGVAPRVRMRGIDESGSASPPFSKYVIAICRKYHCGACRTSALLSGPSPLCRALDCGKLAYLGRGSYNVYRCHRPLLAFMVHYVHVRRSEVASATTFAVVIASYRFTELPFLRLQIDLRSIAVARDKLSGPDNDSEVRPGTVKDTGKAS